MIGIVLSATSIFIWIDTMEAVEAHKDTHDPEDGSDALDTAAASEIVGVQAAAEGLAHSFARSDHDHQIQHGTDNNHLVTIDHDSVVDDDYARFTTDGLEGRSPAEVKIDLGFMTDLVDDVTPQLGGDLDMNGHSIGEVTIGDGIAEDINLITVDEGTADPNKPLLSWNESESSFEMNKDLIIPENDVGIGITSPAADLHIKGTAFPVMTVERETAATNAIGSTFRLLSRSTGDMTDGFGGGIVFSIADDTQITPTNAARIAVVRDGADNSGAMVFATGGLTEKMRLDKDGNLTVSGGLIVSSGTVPTPATEGALFLDTDAGTNGTLKMYSNGAWRDVQAF